MNQKNLTAMEPNTPTNGQGDGSEQRARDMAARYRCEFVDLRDYHLDAELFKTVPVDLMFRYNFVPLEQNDSTLSIAIADPSKLMMIDEIGLLLNRRIRTKVATLVQISDILKKTEQSQRVLEEASEGFVLDVVRDDEGSGDENITIDRITGTAEADVSPIIRLVDTTIFTALQKRASDIHVETESDSVVVKYRIDGVLTPAMQPMAKESMSEKFKNLVLDVVGFDEEDLRKFRRYILEPYGMVLVTGPTGSGKTTTLYAALNEIKTDEDKIITIEDPVEYQIHGITQIPVNEKKGLTFARGLRSILRHDPDKIMVGEIRDTETAQIAIQSALTGHLVFTTVHANNVVDVLGRFLNMGVEPYNFVSALNCVLAQR